MKLPSFLLACVATVLLPSCAQWNIGKKIRESAETHIGINDRMQYNYHEESLPEGYRLHYIAPELRYRLRTPLVDYRAFDEVGERYYAYASRVVEDDIVPTGRLRHVTDTKMPGEASRTEIGDVCETPVEKLTRRPGLESRSTPIASRTHLGSAGRERSTWYPAAVVAAAPFDYLIDPVLSVASTPFLWLGCAGFGFIYMIGAP